MLVKGGPARIAYGLYYIFLNLNTGNWYEYAYVHVAIVIGSLTLILVNERSSTNGTSLNLIWKNVGSSRMQSSTNIIYMCKCNQILVISIWHFVSCFWCLHVFDYKSVAAFPGRELSVYHVVYLSLWKLIINHIINKQLPVPIITVYLTKIKWWINRLHRMLHR